jgi:hypothetical protein
MSRTSARQDASVADRLSQYNLDDWPRGFRIPQSTPSSHSRFCFGTARRCSSLHRRSRKCRQRWLCTSIVNILLRLKNSAGARGDSNAGALPCQGRRPHRSGENWAFPAALDLIRPQVPCQPRLLHLGGELRLQPQDLVPPKCLPVGSVIPGHSLPHLDLAGPRQPDVRWRQMALPQDFKDRDR